MKTVKMLKRAVPVMRDGWVYFPEVDEVLEVSDEDAEALKRGKDAKIVRTPARRDQRTEHEQRADEEAAAAREEIASKDLGAAPENK